MSRLAKHHGKNFAGFFLPWDRPFGMQHLPDPEACATLVSVAGTPHPLSLGEHLLSSRQLKRDADTARH